MRAVSRQLKVPLATTESPGAVLGAVGNTFVPTAIASGLSGAVAGNLYTSAAGVASLAQGDTVQHMGNALYVFDGAGLTLLVGMGAVQINFDSAPVVDHPCYLSPTTAGKATTTLPGISYPAPIWIGVVKQDTSVGAAYSARVDCTRVIQVPASSGRTARIVQDMLANLGGSESDYLIIDDDFNKPYAANPKLPSWGTIADAAAMGDPVPSAIVVASYGANPSLAGVVNNTTTLTQQCCYYASRVKVSTGATNTYWGLSSATDTKVFGFHLWPTSNENGDSTKIFFVWGDPRYEQAVAIPRDAEYHWYYFKMAGDGYVWWKVDDGAWTSVSTNLGVGAVTLQLLKNGGGAVFTIDYVFFATLRF